MSRASLLAPVAAALLIAGCAGGPTRAPATTATGPAAPGPTASGRAAAGDRPGAESGQGAAVPGPASPPSPVTAALLSQSHAQRDAGDLAGAAATIERGLTIAPDDALLWIELAEVRAREGDVDLAEEMARKALTLTDSNSGIAARARRLIRR